MTHKIIKLGSQVVLKTSDNSILTLALVNHEDDFRESKLSISSDLGKSLVNMPAGVSVLIKTGKNSFKKYFILEVR